MINQKLSIVIPTLNRVQTLQDTLDYLMASSIYPSEIIVVDQSTQQEACDKIYELVTGLPVRSHYFHRDPSLTAARNFGLSKAENDIVVFMDDDVRVQKSTLENIINIMDDSSISMIAGLNLNAGKEKSKLGYLFGKKSYKLRNQGYVTSAVYGRLPQAITKRVPTQWAMGYFFVVRKSLVEKWELGWDERFVTYGYPEDLDFSYRYYLKSKQEGFQCIVDPQVSVYHMVSAEYRETSQAVTYMYIINREYLTYKWGLPISSRIMTRWSNFGMFVERMLKRDRCMDVIKAQFYCDLYRKDIKRGNLHTDLYIK